ncbi:MAG: alpha/beta fold hydrolase [Alteromonadaceae bacterium]|nr:alpha/beta fold hydrolase [Alteromonadaceae bacterium]
MSRLLFALTWLCFAASANSNLDILGQLPATHSPKVSPSGEYLAFMQTQDDFYNIVVKNLKNPKVKPKGASLDDARIRSFRWVSDRYIVFTASTPYFSSADNAWFTVFRMGILDAKEGDVEWPFDNRRYRYNITRPSILSLLPDDPEHILVSYYYYTTAGSHQREGVFKVNLSNGRFENLTSSTTSTRWFVNSQGTFLGYQSENEDTEKYELFVYIDDTQVKVLDSNEEPFTHTVGYISDTHVYYFKKQKKGVDALYQMSKNGAQLTNEKLVFALGNFDVDGLLRDKVDFELVGAFGTKDFQQSYYFNDKELAQLQADLEATFPNSEIELTSYTKSRDVFVAAVSGPQNPVEYFIYYPAKGQISLLASEYPDLKAVSNFTVQPYEYRTSDNVSIHGYLAMPDTQKKPPLIVLPHGGPEARDDLSFDWIRQFFVREGFAVLQPNFRGSSGYGRDFVKLGHGQWGKRMQQDIYEGIDSLVEKQLIDPEKICVVGGSYGGYVALLAATQASDKIRCAVSYAGISDLRSFFDSENKQENAIRYFETFIAERDNVEALDAISPLHLVSKNTAPILLMHGYDDTIVDSEQSRLIYNKMTRTGVKDVVILQGKGADHWFSMGSSRTVFLKESLQFINKHIH